MSCRLVALLPRVWLVALALVSIGIPTATSASEPPAVHFAGIAYTGKAAEAPVSLRYAHTAIERVTGVELNRQIAQALAVRSPKHFSLQVSELGSLDGTGSASVMAVALDRETVSTERIADQYKLLYELAAQALFFDFRERQVLFSYPVTLQHIEVFADAPTQEQIQAIADRVVLGREPTSLSGAIAAELESLSLPSASSRRIQLVEVQLAEGLVGRADAQKLDRELIGHEFSKILAANLRLPLLPHALGQAVAGAMPARMADGKAFNLRIPEPDYRLVLEVSDFRSKTLKETPAFRQQLYGAFFHVRVDEPLSSTVFFDQPLRQGATKTIPVSQDQVDTAAAYYETLLTGFSSFAQALAGKDLPWSGEQTGGREFKKQLKALKELISQCR